MTPGQFAGLRQPLSDALLSLFGTGGPVFTGASSALTPFTNPSSSLAGSNPFVSPITPAESGIVSQIAGGAGASTPGQNAANSLILQTLQGKFLSPDSNPFLAATIKTAQQPLIDAFNQSTVPQLKSAFMRAGQRTGAGGSSAFDKAAAIATNGLLQNLGAVSTNLAGQNFQQERQNQLAAAQLPEQFNTQELNNLVTRLQAVALPRLIDQLGINQGLNEFNNRINVLLQALQLAGGLARPTVANSSQSSASESKGIIPALGGGMGIAALGAI